MSHIKSLFVLSILVFLTLTFCNPIMAHDAFKEPMQKRYNFKTVSCKTCHPDNKDRTIRNKFGELYFKALKGKDLTKKFFEAEKEG